MAKHKFGCAEKQQNYVPWLSASKIERHRESLLVAHGIKGTEKNYQESSGTPTYEFQLQTHFLLNSTILICLGIKSIHMY